MKLFKGTFIKMHNYLLETKLYYNLLLSPNIFLHFVYYKGVIVLLFRDFLLCSLIFTIKRHYLQTFCVFRFLCVFCVYFFYVFLRICLRFCNVFCVFVVLFIFFSFFVRFCAYWYFFLEFNSKNIHLRAAAAVSTRSYGISPYVEIKSGTWRDTFVFYVYFLRYFVAFFAGASLNKHFSNIYCSPDQSDFVTVEEVFDQPRRNRDGVQKFNVNLPQSYLDQMYDSCRTVKQVNLWIFEKKWLKFRNF